MIGRALQADRNRPAAGCCQYEYLLEQLMALLASGVGHTTESMEYLLAEKVGQVG